MACAIALADPLAVTLVAGASELARPPNPARANST
jgi:hypothetical protein